MGPTTTTAESFHLIRALARRRGLQIEESHFAELEPMLPLLLTPGAAEALAIKVYRLARVESLDPLAAARMRNTIKSLAQDAGPRARHLLSVASATVEGVVYGLIGTALAQALLAAQRGDARAGLATLAAGGEPRWSWTEPGPLPGFDEIVSCPPSFSARSPISLSPTWSKPLSFPVSNPCPWSSTTTWTIPARSDRSTKIQSLLECFTALMRAS